MRDRVTELLPLLLAGVVLLFFQLSRGSLTLPFLPSPEATPTPLVDVAGARPVVVRRVTAEPLTVVSPVSCVSAQPQFIGGMAALKSVLGARMGEPLECERSVDNLGDTQQKTTTGLAYYRSERNVACFTSGWEHWGLVEQRLVHWAGSDIDPPLDAAVLPR
jgi:hypothetical protein